MSSSVAKGSSDSASAAHCLNFKLYGARQPRANAVNFVRRRKCICGARLLFTLRFEATRAAGVTTDLDCTKVLYSARRFFDQVDAADPSRNMQSDRNRRVTVSIVDVLAAVFLESARIHAAKPA